LVAALVAILGIVVGQSWCEHQRGESVERCAHTEPPASLEASCAAELGDGGGLRVLESSCAQTACAELAQASPVLALDVFERHAPRDDERWRVDLEPGLTDAMVDDVLTFPLVPHAEPPRVRALIPWLLLSDAPTRRGRARATLERLLAPIALVDRPTADGERLALALGQACAAGTTSAEPTPSALRATLIAGCSDDASWVTRAGLCACLFTHSPNGRSAP